MDKLLTQETAFIPFDDHHLLNALPFHIHSLSKTTNKLPNVPFELIQQKLAQQKIDDVS